MRWLKQLKSYQNGFFLFLLCLYHTCAIKRRDMVASWYMVLVGRVKSDFEILNRHRRCAIDWIRFQFSHLEFVIVFYLNSVLLHLLHIHEWLNLFCEDQTLTPLSCDRWLVLYRRYLSLILFSVVLLSKYVANNTKDFLSLVFTLEH